MDIFDDQRIVMTLDAGGTNFVFSAWQGGKEIISPITLAAHADEREKSLTIVIEGFSRVKESLNKAPVAISFAFPGPADYPAGIIDNVGNLPAFAGGVALGPMLEEKFQLPVFINNDGDLFAYGEAMAGLLPEVNRKLKEKKVPKQYKNVFGVTIGTGFGGGIVINNHLARGDNSASGEIWLSRNFDNTKLTAEEGVSIRAIQNSYLENSPDSSKLLSPKEIYDIAKGEKSGNKEAAVQAFERMGKVLGESLANAITLIDGIVVIGGGISGAHDLFLPAVIEHLNGTIASTTGKEFSRLVSTFYNLEDPPSEKAFYEFSNQNISVPYSDKEIPYVPEPRLAIGLSRLGTSQATALGAYAFALNQLDSS
jgi:glucokinase